MLQWTHCIAFYLRAGGSKHLFEYQQEMLISNTEALQDIMENKTPDQLLGACWLALAPAGLRF